MTLMERLSRQPPCKAAPNSISDSLPVVEAGTRLGACVGNVRNLVCIGLNYSDHAAETDTPIPREPVVFNKHTGSISGPNDPVILPTDAQKLDWEVELGVVIGKPAWQIDEADALDHVAGYCLANDVSERAYQLEREGQWTKGKSGFSFAPLGPWLVTRDEVPDPQVLDLWLDVNGTRRQTGNTRTMIFNVAHIVAYLSRFMPLMAGDVIITGHASRRGPRSKAACLSESRRHDDPRRQRTRRADTEDCAVFGIAWRGVGPRRVSVGTIRRFDLQKEEI